MTNRPIDPSEHPSTDRHVAVLNKVTNLVATAAEAVPVMIRAADYLRVDDEALAVLLHSHGHAISAALNDLQGDAASD